MNLRPSLWALAVLGKWKYLNGSCSLSSDRHVMSWLWFHDGRETLIYSSCRAEICWVTKLFLCTFMYQLSTVRAGATRDRAAPLPGGITWDSHATVWNTVLSNPDQRSQNHRMSWLGRNPSRSLSPTPGWRYYYCKSRTLMASRSGESRAHFLHFSCTAALGSGDGWHSTTPQHSFVFPQSAV